MLSAARRHVLVVLAALLVALLPSGGVVMADTGSAVSGPVGPSGSATATRTVPAAVPDTVPDTLPEANVYLPEDRDVGDCLSSLPKPDCGNENEGGPAQLLTFVVLMLGMAFIGWRIFRSVRRRDQTPTP